MKQKHDIFALIRADHRKVESIFENIEKTSERATATREKLYSELQNELRIHTETEERALYPGLKGHEETESFAFEGAEEHSVVKFLLDRLDGTVCESKEWSAQIKALKEAVEHHVKEEEEEMFPKMRKAFNAEELDTFALMYGEMKARTKTEHAEAA